MSRKSSPSSIKARQETKAILQQKFKNFQQDWESYKQSNLRGIKRGFSCTASSDPEISKAFQLLGNSPENLMYSLQQTPPSPRETRNLIKPYDLAVKEIIGDRRVAIESGKFKGKRLFQVEGTETEEEAKVETGFFLAAKDIACIGRTPTMNLMDQDYKIMSGSLGNSDCDQEAEEYLNDMPTQLCTCFHRGSFSSSSASFSPCQSGKAIEEDDLGEEENIKPWRRDKTVAKARMREGYNVRVCKVLSFGIAAACTLLGLYVNYVGSFARYEEITLVPS